MANIIVGVDVGVIPGNFDVSLPRALEGHSVKFSSPFQLHVMVETVG